MHDPRLSFASLATDAQPVSPSDLSGIHAVDLSGVLSGHRVDLHKARCIAPGKWSEFIRANFRNPVAVAYFFDIDEKTARNWWNGKHEPRLSAVSAMLRVVPVNARIAIVNFLTEAA